MKLPSRETVWGGILTAVFAGFLASIGFLWNTVDTLRIKQVQTQSTRFTKADSEELKDFISAEMESIRDDLSQVNADIDKRLAIMEVHVKYLTPAFQPDINRFLKEETTLMPPAPIPAPIPMPPVPIWAPNNSYTPVPTPLIAPPLPIPEPPAQNIPDAPNVQQRYPYDIRKK
jgi:hypothetical protein